jgi:adenylate cyclase
MREEIHRVVLDSMADGVISVDLDGTVTTFNAAAARILGAGGADAVGRGMGELLYLEEGLDAFNDVLLTAVQEGRLADRRSVEVRVAGQRRHLVVSTSIVQDGSGARIGAVIVFEDSTDRMRRQTIERLFGTYLDRRVAEMLLAMEEDERDRGRRAEMTVLFCDLAGFTGLSQSLGGDALLGFVNAFIAAMSGPVAETGGITDKFIGDAVMAFWGPPFSAPDAHAAAACRAALLQLDALPAFRERARPIVGDAAAARLDIRIGIATGEVTAGSVGLSTRRNFTVIGDVVNTAARLEAVNKEHGTRVLCSAATARDAGGAFAFRRVGSVRLRGRAEAEPVFELGPAG